jgi:H+/Cl- antiporter ClcA
VHRRREDGIRRQWRIIRRLGQGWFATLLIASFWLMMLPTSFFAAWYIDPSLKVLHRLPGHFYHQLCFLVPFLSFGLFLGARYAWRENERKYHG